MTENETRQRWPVVGHLYGIAVVTIPQAEYERLLQCRLKLAKWPGRGSAPRRATSAVFKDKELAKYVDGCLDSRLTHAAVHAACVDKFGADRTPSLTSISRYSLWRRQNSRLSL